MLNTTPLMESFGAIVSGIDLGKVSPDHLYPELRALFEEHSALLFRDQELSSENHLRVAGLFGPIEDRLADTRKPGSQPSVSQVSNVLGNGMVVGEADMHSLHLKANQQWHIDSTFMPVPSLCNMLAAKVVTTEGGETELASTRAAWACMPERLRTRIRGKTLGHNYTRSRERVSKQLAAQEMFTKWPPQRWPAVWENPVNGLESLFIASHVFEVEGLGQEEGDKLIDELIDFCTQPRFRYSHSWRTGDVLLWDQRAVLHRGRPWPLGQPRTLVSVCCSMTESDGLAAARRKLGG